MDDPKISNSSLALTQEEIDVLKSMVDAGDRAGFYMAYYAIAVRTTERWRDFARCRAADSS